MDIRLLSEYFVTTHHVGMYIGNGQYIHAPKIGDFVKVSDLASRSDYCTARRIHD